MYSYSSYWRTWSRVLLMNFDGQCIELNLTHVNGDWSGVMSERIRLHRTAKASDDRVQTTLPVSIYDSMLKALGATVTNRLLTFDYLPHIDWTKYTANNNGGAAFESVRLNEFRN